MCQPLKPDVACGEIQDAGSQAHLGGLHSPPRAQQEKNDFQDVNAVEGVMGGKMKGIRRRRGGYRRQGSPEEEPG